MDDWLKYSNAGKIRNQPISPQLYSALGSFLPAMGITMEVFSGGQDAIGQGDRRTGSTRHDHGGAADVFFYKDGRRLDWSNPADVPIFKEIVKQGRAAGITGFGAGPGYMLPGSMHIGFGPEAVWGAGGKGANAADWLREAYGMAPAGSAPVVASTKGGAVMADGGLLGAPEAPKKKGLAGLLSDPDKLAMLAIGLEGMTLNPNAALVSMLGGQVQERRETKKADASRNRTAQWLRSVGQDQLAAALETGAVDPGAVIGQALQAMQPVPAEPPKVMQVGDSIVSIDPATGQSSVLYTAPPGSDVPASFAALDMQAKAAGLAPGSQEYKDFMLRGGLAGNAGRPAAFEALHQQALAAGFAEGSPEYKDFMATRGAGLAAEAKVIGEQRGAATAGAPSEIAQSDQTLSYIEELRKHPGMSSGTGIFSMLNVIPGTPGYDFQNRVNQLKSGAFLTAIDQLRGMGALSNAEGQTATAALARLDTATSEGEFLAALADYEKIVQMGRERAAKRIKSEEPAVAPDAAPAPAPVRKKYNPATGAFE